MFCVSVLMDLSYLLVFLNDSEYIVLVYCCWSRDLTLLFVDLTAAGACVTKHKMRPMADKAVVRGNYKISHATY